MSKRFSYRQSTRRNGSLASFTLTLILVMIVYLLLAAAFEQKKFSPRVHVPEELSARRDVAHRVVVTALR